MEKSMPFPTICSFHTSLTNGKIMDLSGLIYKFNMTDMKT